MNYQYILDDICCAMRQQKDRGEVADYIPELAVENVDQFGISLWFANGQSYSSGDFKTRFSIQSVSKVFALAIALGRVGDKLWERVGRQPSDQSFDSIIQLELEKGHPRNPFINAGAIVTTDTILANNSPKEALAEILSFIRLAASDDDILINKNIAQSEKKTAFRNYALANYMYSHGNLINSVDLILGTYFHQCSIEMTCEQLARSGSFLVDADRGNNLLTLSTVKKMNALMLTCGHYNGSGEFAFHVGLPGKSGVSGAILAVVPKVCSIAVWSPGLNNFGNSKLGTQAMEMLVRKTGWSIFA